jgi:hypothetical protein
MKMVVSETLPHLRALQAICLHHLNTNKRHKNATLGMSVVEGKVSQNRYQGLN